MPSSALLYRGGRKVGVALIRRDGEIFRGPGASWEVVMQSNGVACASPNYIKPYEKGKLEDRSQPQCVRACVCMCVTSSTTLCRAGGVASGLFILSLSCNGSPSSFQVLTFLLFSPHAPFLRMSHFASSILPNPIPLPPPFCAFVPLPRQMIRRRR